MPRSSLVPSLYLSGGLFSSGQRLHNVLLARCLRALGHRVILPQEEVVKFSKVGGFDTASIAKECKRFCQDSDVVCIVNIDGSDADSGAAVEYGIAMQATGRAIVYRTDFRTSLKNEAGVNGMFGLEGTHFIYKPCFATEDAEMEDYYLKLSAEIDEAVMKIMLRQKS